MFTAAAMWWRRMGRRTTSGKNRLTRLRGDSRLPRLPARLSANGSMNTSSILIYASLAILALFAGGCAGTQDVAQAQQLSENCLRADALVRESRAEQAALRSEMAATRIAAAKREAEFHELRLEIQELRAAGASRPRTQAELSPGGNALQAELNDLRKERARLMEENADLQVRASKGSPRPEPEIVASSGNEEVQERVAELEASVMALTTQLQDMKGTQDGSDPTAALEVPVSDFWVITVKRGDTLAKLAQAHGVTVEQIQAANGLSGDLILVGQPLRIPRSGAESR